MVITNIKKLIDAGWSQGRIARESGISQPSITRILKGKQNDVHYTKGKKLEELAEKVGAGGAGPLQEAA